MGWWFLKRNLLIQEQSVKSSWPLSQTISHNHTINWKQLGYITVSQKRQKKISEIFYWTQVSIVLGMWTLAVINFAYLNNNWLRHTVQSQLPLSDQYAWLKQWNHSNLTKNALFFPVTCCKVPVHQPRWGCKPLCKIIKMKSKRNF